MKDKLKYLTGHQSFYLRQRWLSKAVQAINNERNLFSEKDLIGNIDDLGIGSNMVKSLRYWSKVFNIVAYENKEYILTKDVLHLSKYDPTFQSKFSKWILHIWASKNLPTWRLFFVRDKLTLFTKDQLLDRLDIVLHEEGTDYRKKTLKELIDIFLNLYRDTGENNPEENNVSPLAGLKIIEQLSKNEFRFRLINEDEVPKEIILYILGKEQPHNQLSFDMAYEIVKDFIKIDYYSLRKIIEKLEISGNLHFDRAVGLDNIIINNKSEIGVKTCFKGSRDE